MQCKLLCKIQECFEMPSKTKFLLGTLLLLSLSLTAYSQVLPSPPTAYVSSGPTIYKVTVATGTVTPIFTSPNSGLHPANFESVAIGPDNAFTDTDGSCGLDCGNAAHPYLLYACDTSAAPSPTANSIIRFDPTAALPITAQTVASGLAFPPICGRSTATSDFYVTNKSGPGVYQLMASSKIQTCSAFINSPTVVPVGCFPFVPDPGLIIGATATTTTASLCQPFAAHHQKPERPCRSCKLATPPTDICVE